MLKPASNPDTLDPDWVLLKLVSNGVPFDADFNASLMLVQIIVRARVQ